MCKICVKPVYGTEDGSEQQEQWGRKSSISEYSDPLDFTSVKDLQKPPTPTQVRRNKLKKSESLAQISPQEEPTTPLKKSTSLPEFPPNEEKSDSNKDSKHSKWLHAKGYGRLDNSKLHQSISKLDAIDEDQSKVLEEVFESSAEIDENGLSYCGKREVGTLTEVHYQDNVAEVDLISLVEEQIPKYVLRADTITDFTGYDNRDFGRTLSHPAEVDLELSPELIEETLKYFILSSDRLSQMTKTYNDIEAVTRLLEEKETDLELAARIGQQLLEKSKKLDARNEVLEDELNVAIEKISQLRHELNMKDALLQAYNDDYELDVLDSPGEKTAIDRSLSQCEALRTKLKKLEEDNILLKLQADKLSNETCELEEKEVNLVSDCVSQLDDANRKIKQLTEEMKVKAEICVAQQEENTNLLSKVITVETNYKKQVAENSEMQKQMKEMRVTQMELTHEIMELEEKYNECMALLHEKTEEIKGLRKKTNPGVIHQHYGTSPFFRPEGSLALELEKSETEEFCPPEYKTSQRKKHMSKVLETAKTVNKTIKRSISHSSLSSLSINSGLSEEGSLYNSNLTDTLSVDMSDNESMMSESCSQTDMDGFNNIGNNTLGKPGIPGSNDLETALRRLAIRRANEINQSYMEEMDSQNGNLTVKPVEGDDTPTPCPTPDSYMSTGSGSNFSSLPGSFRVPEKLQIVKPMEGSLTLHQWQRLATPRLEGIFEVRPGVQIRGEKKMEMEEEIYTLSDYEEDDDLSYLQAKAADNTAGTYTYTTAKIMHPTDEYDTFVTSVHSDVKLSSNPAPPKKSTAKRPTSLPLSQTTSSCHGTTTFSMSFSLAAMLHERGLQQGLKKHAPKQKQGFLSRVSSWMTAPKRFSSITTEKLTDTANSQTETIYSQSSIVIPPLEGISASKEPMPYRPENAYLNLVDKVRELGLSNVMGIAHSSGISPVKKDPVDVGLNTVMFIRRNRVTGAPTRASAQTLVSSGSSSKEKRHVFRKDSKDNVTTSSANVKSSFSRKSSKETSSGSRVEQTVKSEAITNSGKTDIISTKAPVPANVKAKSGGLFDDISINQSGVIHRSTSGHSNKKSIESQADNQSQNGAKQPIVEPQFTATPSMVYPSNQCIISHSKVSGLGYAVTPPDFGSASVARDRVYTSLATGRSYSGTAVTNCYYSNASNHNNVGTGTIHSPLTYKESTGNQPMCQAIGTASVQTVQGSISGVIGSSVESGQGSGLFGSTVKLLSMVKPESSGLIGALTSTPITKSK